MSESIVVAVVASKTSSLGQRGVLADHLDPRLVGDVADEDDLDDAAPRPCRARSPRRSPRRASSGRGDRARARRAPSAICARLVEAVQHRVDDLVDAARADRVVRGVADDLEPGRVEERRGHSCGAGRRACSAARRVARARCSVLAAARFTSTRLEATPISMFARNPLRSSPSHTARPSLGAASRYAARLESSKR